jgi:lipopolysaccharide export system permease protein
LQAAGINADLFNLAFWKKVLQPLFSFSLVMVAMSFVFGSQRAVPMGQRVLFGVLTGLGFNYAQDILGPASSIFGFSPVVAYLLPIMLCLLMAWRLFKRVN